MTPGKKTLWFYLLLLLFFLSLCFTNLYCDASTDLIADQIVLELIKSYDNYENKSFLEKMVLKYGRKTYIDNLKIWRQNYQDLDQIVIHLHPKLVELTEKVEKHTTSSRAQYLEKELQKLTGLGYRNIHMYYTAVIEYKEDLQPREIDIWFIGRAINRLKYYQLKKELYGEEEQIKKKIKAVIGSRELKFKLAFYNFAFDFLNKIRTKIIQRDLAAMYKIIQTNAD